jgi:hypothetical protein
VRSPDFLSLLPGPVLLSKASGLWVAFRRARNPFPQIIVVEASKLFEWTWESSQFHKRLRVRDT